MKNSTNKFLLSVAISQEIETDSEDTIRKYLDEICDDWEIENVVIAKL